jgi:hypothetical protein
MPPTIEGDLSYETGEGTLPTFSVNLLDQGNLRRQDFEDAARQLFLSYPDNSYLQFVVVSDIMHCFPEDPTDEYTYAYLARLLNAPMDRVQSVGRIGIDNQVHTMWLDEDFLTPRDPNDSTPTYGERVISHALPGFFKFI